MLVEDLGSSNYVHDYRRAHEVLARVDSALAQLGLVPHESSRFSVHRRRLRNALAKGDVVHEGTLLHLRGIQQAYLDLCVLDRALTELRPGVLWKPHLERVLGGNDLPWRDRHDVARNTEFELYLAAVLRRAGCRVSPAEPDLHVITSGWHIAVAAKRLRSPKKLLDRVNEGMTQLRSAKVPGFVMVDATACCLAGC